MYYIAIHRNVKKEFLVDRWGNFRNSLSVSVQTPEYMNRRGPFSRKHSKSFLSEIRFGEGGSGKP